MPGHFYCKSKIFEDNTLIVSHTSVGQGKKGAKLMVSTKCLENTNMAEYVRAKLKGRTQEKIEDNTYTSTI